MQRRRFLLASAGLVGLACLGCGSGGDSTNLNAGAPGANGGQNSSALIRANVLVVTGASGRVYEIDPTQHAVFCLNSRDEVIWSLGDPLSPSPLNRPFGLVELPDGRVLIADPGRGQVVVVDRSGQVQGSWGQGVDALALDLNGQRLVVSNPLQNRLDFYSFQGTLQSSLGDLVCPRGLAVGPDGSIYVAEPAVSRITRFNSQGQVSARWTTGLQAPRNLLLTGGGILLVADLDAGLLALDAQGRLLGQQNLLFPDGAPARPIFLGLLNGQIHVTASHGA